LFLSWRVCAALNEPTQSAFAGSGYAPVFITATFPLRLGDPALASNATRRQWWGDKDPASAVNASLPFPAPAAAAELRAQLARAVGVPPSRVSVVLSAAADGGPAAAKTATVELRGVRKNATDLGESRPASS
jgi:hypothetical protein